MTKTDAAAARIRLLCLDVDGVLTDGSILLEGFRVLRETTPASGD